MKFETLSLVAGTKACNAKCPYCCAKFTAEKQPVQELDTRNLRTCIQLANRSNIDTALITGWGEPTLYMQHIEKYCKLLKAYSGPPLIELQTNGIRLQDNNVLRDLKAFGINTIAVSCVSPFHEDNQRIFGTDYPDLIPLFQQIKEHGFTVRLMVIGLKGCVDDFGLICATACAFSEVDQFTWKPVVGYEKGRIPFDNLIEIEEGCNREFTTLYNLPYGGTVYDYNGINVCVTNCLTLDPEKERIRQLIYLPNGRVTYDWQHEGAVILA